MGGWFIIRMGGKTIAKYSPNELVTFLLPPWMYHLPMKVETHEDEEGNIIIDIGPEDEEE